MVPTRLESPLDVIQRAELYVKVRRYDTMDAMTLRTLSPLILLAIF